MRVTCGCGRPSLLAGYFNTISRDLKGRSSPTHAPRRGREARLARYNRPMRVASRSVGVIGAFAVSMACGGGPAPPAPAAAPGATTTASTATAAATTEADGPLPEVASPYDALPPEARGLLDRPFTGDLDQMVKRRVIRAGVTFNRTHYFIDKGQQRGAAYEALMNFEEALNAQLKTGLLRVHVAVVPVAAGHAHSGPDRGESGRRGRPAHRHARTAEAGGLQQSDAEQCLGDRGHGSGQRRGLLSGRSVRQGGVRPHLQQLPRQPAGLERAAQGCREASGSHQAGPGEPRRRRHPRDGQRRPGAGHRRRRLPGAVLEAGVPRPRAPPGCGAAHRRRARGGHPEGQSETEGSRQSLAAEIRQAYRLRQRPAAALPRKHEVREERCGRPGTAQVQRDARCLPQVQSGIRSTRC